MTDNVKILPVSDIAEMAQRLLDIKPKHAVLVMIDDESITIRNTRIEDTVKTIGALECAKLHIWGL